jgi:parallel beta-helix repeat protein
LSSDSNTLEDNTISSNTWQGVYIDNCDDNEVLGNTITANWVGIHCDNGSDGTIIESNTISSNNPINIYITGASTDITITCNTISSAGWGGIQFLSGSTGVVHMNNIVGNPVGLWNDGPSLLDAENNWWGDDSGPNHWITNPGGLGDSVTDNVDFDPWIKNTVIPTTGGDCLVCDECGERGRPDSGDTARGSSGGRHVSAWHVLVPGLLSHHADG